MKSLLYAAAVFLALPVQAQGVYYARNGLNVTPAGPVSFYISGVPRNTPQSYWCAGAEYAHRVLRAGFNQRMYIVGDYVRGQRRYLISLSPKGTASENGRIKEFGVRIDGANRRIDVGLDDCKLLFFPFN